MHQKLLILDDDEEIVALLAQAFRSLPFDIVFVTSGVEAVIAIFEAYSEEKPFDALVMDCALPRLDGFTIAKIVRLAETTGVSKRTKIGYFTAFPKTVEQSTLLEEVGAQAYWRKPEDTGNLPTLISLWLNGPG
ncbi:MAG: hypothetical protein DMF69_23990 [Acidobacteria bacterium]|nr:MAG: hypothetical protein DMF69_23990 [Acidobacteriota bacterium]